MAVKDARTFKNILDGVKRLHDNRSLQRVQIDIYGNKIYVTKHEILELFKKLVSGYSRQEEEQLFEHLYNFYSGKESDSYLRSLLNQDSPQVFSEIAQEEVSQIARLPQEEQPKEFGNWTRRQFGEIPGGYRGIKNQESGEEAVTSEEPKGSKGPEEPKERADQLPAISHQLSDEAQKEESVERADEKVSKRVEEKAGRPVNEPASSGVIEDFRNNKIPQSVEKTHPERGEITFKDRELNTAEPKGFKERADQLSAISHQLSDEAQKEESVERATSYPAASKRVDEKAGRPANEPRAIQEAPKPVFSRGGVEAQGVLSKAKGLRVNGGVNLSNFRARTLQSIPYPLKNFALNSKTFILTKAKVFAARYPQLAGPLLGGAFGGVLGFGMTGQASGMFGGFAGGSILTVAAQNGVLGNFVKGLGGGNNGGGGRIGGGVNIPGFSGGGKGFFGNMGRVGVTRGGGGTAAASPITNVLPGKRAFLGIFLLFFGLVFLTGFIFPPTANQPGSGSGGGTGAGGSQNKVTIQKTGPATIGKGSEIAYQIIVGYAGSGQADIQVTDQLPPETSFIEASKDDNHSYNDTSKVASWKIEKLSSGQSKTLSLKIKAPDKDVWITNTVKANILSISGGGGAPGVIGSCSFTRAGQSNPVGSNKLKEIFAEVSAKSGIPASVLASVAMHENPGFVINAKDDHKAFESDVIGPNGECKHFNTSPTGALGFMQVQPSQRILPTARADAHDGTGVRLGAEMMGKTYEGLTMSDHCDVRSSVYLGAGVLLSKNGRKAPATPDEIENAVCKYYGSPCTYGNGHNYGKEAREDFLRCQSQQPPAASQPLPQGGGPSSCSGTPITFSSAQKVLLPLPSENQCSATETKSCGRPGECITPRKIVMHTTSSSLGARETYEYFAKGSERRGVGAHFIVGKDGEVLQIVEMFDSNVEIAYAVRKYSDHISIEITSPKTFNSISELPKVQYEATLKLTKELMNKYNIPIGNLEFDWKAPSNEKTDLATPGIYGHYQLNPDDRHDPGLGFMREFREMLKK